MEDTLMPETASLRFTTVEANGLSFNVATAGEGERLALCLHGAPELSYSWRHQLPVLADLGYRVWAPDMRGFGGTTRPPLMADYAMENLVDDIAALIDASGAATTTIIGHDWGGIAAWWFAMWKRRPIERLAVLNAPHPALIERGTRRVPRQWPRSLYVAFYQLPRLPERVLSAREGSLIGKMFTRMAVHPERFGEDDIALYRRAFLEPGAMTAMLNVYRAYVRGGGMRRLHRGGYPIVDVPTLFIWGERDAALVKALTYGTEGYASDLTVRYIPDASHWVQQDAPDVVNVMLTAWLTGEPVPLASEVVL
jgi:epoxide hydrolase 4